MFSTAGTAAHRLKEIYRHESPQAEERKARLGNVCVIFFLGVSARGKDMVGV